MISNCGVTAPWPPGISNATNFGREKITRLTPTPGVTLMECDVTGAVALADKRAITARVAFRAHDYGEQVPFCMDLCHAGYRPAVDCRPGCIHAMDPSQLSVALGKFVEANGYAPGGTKPAPDALPPFAIIIPQREDKTQPLRERNRKWVTAYWKAQVPEATVVAGIDPGPGDFNRARARNAGAAAAPANTEVFVFADADGIVGPEHLRQAVRIAAAGMPASPACWLEILLDEEAAAVCAGDPSVAPGIRKDPCRGVCGLDYYLINAISRKQFAEVGGYDERFADYGGEDLSLAAVVRTLLGGPASVDAHAYHLQHETPIGGREQLTPATEAHQARYRAAEGDAAAMRALIVGKPFPEPARWEKVRGGWLTFPPTEPDTVVAEYLASADGGAYHHLSLAGAFVPGTVLLDAGAHAGSETVRALRAGAAHVYAVEPHPVHLTHLRRNIEEMGAEDGPGRVTVIPKALGAKAATAAGFTYDGGGSHLDPAGTTTVAVVRGDTLALDPAPTLYKFDIEGAEEDALRGLADTIRSTSPRPGIILCLYHRPGDVERLPALLAEIDPRYGEPTEANSTCAYWARGDA
jgi:FkbM family methyltransferase